MALRDGKRIWSHVSKNQSSANFLPSVALADLDGDKKSEVVIVDEPAAGKGFEVALRALRGRDGSALWTWRRASPRQDQSSPARMCICLADFIGNGQRSVCIGFNISERKNRIIVLDALGRELAGRDLPGDRINSLNAASLTGDQRDELLLCQGERLSVLGSDLKTLWSSRALTEQPPFVLPASSGRAGTVMAYPLLGLSGKDGVPQWAGQSPLDLHTGFRQSLLDPGSASRLPLLTAPGIGSTVCRSALPVTPEGAHKPPPGALTKPNPSLETDPRWLKPLPWVARSGVVGPETSLTNLGLALVNIVLPLLILRLATGRRPRSMRLLMALPVAAAVPLMVYLTVAPARRARPSTSDGAAQFVEATLLGVPLACLAASLAWFAARRHYRQLFELALILSLSAFAIGSLWLWVDSRLVPIVAEHGWSAWHEAIVPGACTSATNTLPAREQYDWRQWYLAILPGAYAAGVFTMTAWMAKAVRRRR